MTFEGVKRGVRFTDPAKCKGERIRRKKVHSTDPLLLGLQVRQQP